MQALSTRRGALLAELRELPVGLATPVVAGLLVADTLRAIGYDDDAIVAAVGVDLAAVEGATPEEALAALERGVPAFARLVGNGAPVG